MDPVFFTKLIFLVIFFVEALALGLVPVFCKSFSESPAALGIANSFSGGVFMAISLVHILPE
jgi:zinc transporter ZupT